MPPNDHLDDPIRLAAGDKHACRIADDGRLWCWGNNANAQLGASTAAMTGTPVIATDGTWDWVAAGARHTCAISVAHELYCWGDDSGGQVGDSLEPNAAPTKLTLPNNATPAKVFAGDIATCAIDDAGLLYCWGTFDIDRTVVPKPQRVQPGGIDGSWRSVAIADDHACALHDGDNLVYCWGKADVDQLGVDDDREIGAASAKPDREFIAISVGHEATCGVTVDRELVCFGNPAGGLIGPVMTPTSDLVVDATRRWTALAVGASHTCAVGDGSVFCFGKDSRGALGDGFEARVDLSSAAVLPARRVVAGDSFSCSYDDDGVTSCWGANAYGELGNTQVATKRTPTLIPLPGDVSGLAVGHGHTCAVLSSSALYCWGDNRTHQVSSEAAAGNVVTPTLYSTHSFLEVSAGRRHTCGIDAGDPSVIHCWGNNAQRQLATGDIHVGDVSTGSTRWNHVTAGLTTTCGVTGDGRLVCWGDLPGGMAAANPTVATDTPYTRAALGAGFAIASFTASGSQDDVVQLGKSDDCNVTRPFPSNATIQPGRPSNAWRLAAALDGNHVCALDTFTGPAELFCWGSNTSGEVGATPSACEAPTQIAHPNGGAWLSSSLWSSISVGLGHSCALDSMLDAYCWGVNDHGELGSLSDSHTPHRIPSPVRFEQIATGPDHTCAIAGDGTGNLYCWGENRFGELGNGESFHPDPHAIVFPQ